MSFFSAATLAEIKGDPNLSSRQEAERTVFFHTQICMQSLTTFFRGNSVTSSPCISPPKSWVSPTCSTLPVQQQRTPRRLMRLKNLYLQHRQPIHVMILVFVFQFLIFQMILCFSSFNTITVPCSQRQKLTVMCLGSGVKLSVIYKHNKMEINPSKWLPKQRKVQTPRLPCAPP